MNINVNSYMLINNSTVNDSFSVTSLLQSTAIYIGWDIQGQYRLILNILNYNMGTIMNGCEIINGARSVKKKQLERLIQEIDHHFNRQIHNLVPPVKMVVAFGRYVNDVPSTNFIKELIKDLRKNIEPFVMYTESPSCFGLSVLGDGNFNIEKPSGELLYQ